MARFEYGPAEIIGAVQDSGLVYDSVSKTRRLLGLVMNFLNDIPIWGNNGWSSTELYRRETSIGVGGESANSDDGGKRVSCDKNGKPRKIDRNEPCPCGSEKKCKRCCGR